MATPYRCTEGHLTIGYGVNLDAGITEEEAEVLLRMRVDKIANTLKDTFTWYTHLDGQRQGVIINMVYNIGLNGFMKFKKMIAALEAKDYTTATMEMLQSKWAKQVGNRAARLAKEMKP